MKYLYYTLKDKVELNQISLLRQGKEFIKMKHLELLASTLGLFLLLAYYIEFICLFI